MRWVRLTVKIPKAKTPQRISFRLSGSWDCKKTGIGRMMIMMSEEIFMTALVIMWFVSAEQFTSTVSHMSQAFMFRYLTVIWRNLPVMVERSTPSSEPQNLHNHKSNDNVSSYNFDQEVLFQTQPSKSQSLPRGVIFERNSRKSAVHKQ